MKYLKEFWFGYKVVRDYDPLNKQGGEEDKGNESMLTLNSYNVLQSDLA